jgi:cytochrome c oxidase subunit I
MADASIPVPGSLEGVVDRTQPEAAKGTWLEHIHGWIVTVDHKRIGILYISMGLIFLLIGGLEALLIRMQLIRPLNNFIPPETFNRLFTLHGTTMVFLVGMPILFGFGNYLIPLMIGARDMAFPRLNAFSFWISALAGLLFYYSLVGGFGLFGAGSAPDVGWFAYAPLTELAFSPGHSTDYWTVALLLSGIGTIGTAVNIIATVFSMRCKGMTLMRMPLLPWLYITMSTLVLLAVSPLTAAQIMLMIDRYLGGHFFDTQAGGSAVLWFHFFWIFGHPEVYVLVFPAFAFANEIVPTFSRKAIFGYPAMVVASVGIAFISTSVWAHHMFTVGMTSVSNTFFTLSTMLVAMLFTTAFLFQFVAAGLTGIILSVAPFDWQVHFSYFLIAHFHYVLVGAIIFMIFAAFYYWYPKATGKMLDDRLGKLHFGLMLVGFHLTFDVMFIVGLVGMPRHIYTYMADRPWATLNQIISFGGLLQGLGTLVFLGNLFYSYFRGREAGPDPWDAWTLEWATSSPPPPYNFASEPQVASRRPLWDLKHPEDPDYAYE